MLYFQGVPIDSLFDSIYYQTLDLLISKANFEVSSALQISLGQEVFKLRQLIILDDIPYGISDTFFLSPKIFEDLGSYTQLTFKQLLKLFTNQSTFYLNQSIKAIPTDLTLQNLLGIDFVLNVTQLIKNATTGATLCLHELYLNPEYYSFSSDTLHPINWK